MSGPIRYSTVSYWVGDCHLLTQPASYRISYGVSHYGDVMMTRMASWITSLTIVYSIVYSGVDQRKLQSSASLAFVRWIHRRPVNSPHKWPVTRKMFPFDDVIVLACCIKSIFNSLWPMGDGDHTLLKRYWPLCFGYKGYGTFYRNKKPPSWLQHRKMRDDKIIALNVEAKPKWPPFCRRNFQVHFGVWKLLYFD